MENVKRIAFAGVGIMAGITIVGGGLVGISLVAERIRINIEHGRLYRSCVWDCKDCRRHIDVLIAEEKSLLQRKIKIEYFL